MHLVPCDGMAHCLDMADEPGTTLQVQQRALGVITSLRCLAVSL